MEQDTVSSDEVDAYWRRRVIALGGALGVVGLLVWACSGSGSRAGGQKHVVSNAAAVSTPSPSPVASAHSAPAAPMPTVTVTAKVTVTPTAPKRAGDACDAKDVVVTLGPTKATYAGKEHPQFRLSVVNTGARACTFGVGPKELAVQIVSGSDRVWTSARCFAGTGSSIQLLQRGVPYAGTIDWDRHRSTTDCGGKHPAARPGTYTVQAKGGGTRTRKAVFVLR